MKNFQKITFIMVALLSQTAFAATSTDMRLINAITAENPSLATIQKLLTIPAVKNSINMQYNTGYTPLMWAVSYENLPITQALIAAGAKTTPQSNQANDSCTALIVAVTLQTPSLPLVEALFKAPDLQDGPHMKGSLNMQDSNGFTALMYAVSEGSLPITQALLAAGADATIANKQGQTALSVSQPNCEPIIQTAYWKTLYTNLLNAIYNNDLSGVKKALAAGVNLNEPINVANVSTTALIYAVQVGHIAMVKALAETKGINANLQDSTGTTALMHAAANNSLPIVKLLVKIPGINLNIINNTPNAPENGTALNYAYGYLAQTLASESSTNPMIQQEKSAKNCIDFLKQQGAVGTQVVNGNLVLDRK